jgi:hypothetical protein
MNVGKSAAKPNASRSARREVDGVDGCVILPLEEAML